MCRHTNAGQELRFPCFLHGTNGHARMYQQKIAEESRPLKRKWSCACSEELPLDCQHIGSKHATGPSCNMVRNQSFTDTQHVLSNILCALRLS